MIYMYVKMTSSFMITYIFKKFLYIVPRISSSEMDTDITLTY